MSIKNFYFIVITLLLISYGLSAQTYSKGHEDKKTEANFTELANYYKDHPALNIRKKMPEEEEEAEERHNDLLLADPSLVHKIHVQASRLIGGLPYPSYLPVSPAPNDTFLATLSNGSYIPPDTHGGVDSTYCITAVNSSIHIQNKATGANVSSLSLDAFWASLLSFGGGSFDPRVHYDPISNRWIMVTFAYGKSSNSQMMLAVSKSSNPTAGWWMYKVVVDPTGLSWLDFPNVGFNGKWIVVTGNFFQNSSGGQTGAVAYVFDKVRMIAGTGAPYMKIADPASFTMCPAMTYDPVEPNIFVVNIYNNFGGQLNLRKISGTVASPILSGTIGFPTSSDNWSYNGNSGSDFMKQSVITNQLDGGDDRITNLTFRNNKLWCAHTVFLPYGTPTRSSIMWWQIDTNANPLQNGIIDDPATPSFFAYPSITVNANDDALLGFTNVSSLIHPSCAYTLRMHTDPPDSMRALRIFRHGRNTYFQNFGGFKNRWGDYSATCVDPSNNLDFWTIQESVSNTANLWDTWWAQVKICPADAEFYYTKPTVNILVNDTFAFAGTAPTGTTFTWDFAGGTAIPGTGVGPQSIQWTTIGWKVVTLTVSVGTCSNIFTDSVLVTNTAGINAIDNHDVVEIFPNPSSGMFNVEIKGNSIAQISISVYDILGRNVKTVEGLNTNKVSVNLSDQPSGNYFIKVSSDNYSFYKKITIIK